MKIQSKKIITVGFLFSIALFPFISLFWQDYLPYANFKVSWVLYPIVLVCAATTIFIRNSAPKQFYYLVGSAIVYIIFTILHKGDFESLFRFGISLLPLTFIGFFYDQNNRSENKWFWFLYCTAFSIPLFYAYLQYTDKMPYYDFDVINGEYVGRISGGYNKPMNFIAFLFPIYLGGFYLVLIKKRKMIGYSIVISIIFLLVIIGHRTSLISFLVVFISFFFQRSTIRILYNYYKYFLNFIVGISAFLGFYFFYYFFGLKDAMRGRVAMWEAHAQFFFDSSAFEILFGKQFILLDPKYAHENLIGPLALFEAHNNTFRTIIFFGVLGFLAYCIFMRWVVLKVHSIAQDGRILFLMFSCFTFLVLYSITNEPFYYGSVLWPILIWIFLAQSIKQDERHES